MMNKTMKRIGAALLASMMTVVMAMPVMAAGTVIAPTAAETDASAENVITKNFIMSKDLAIPAETFAFTASAIQLTNATNNGETTVNGTTIKTDDCPAIKIGSAEVTATTASTTGNITVDSTSGLIIGFAANADGAYKLVQIQTSILCGDDNHVLKGTDFKHAGEYVYTVTETTGANDSIAYSKASYQLHIFVANKAAGGLYISGISAVRTTDNDTSQAAASTTPVKVDITGSSAYGTTGNQLDFQNLYFKTSKLTVSKKVAGAYGDQTLPFEFKITLNLPNDNPANKITTLTGYLYETTNGTDYTRVQESGADKTYPVTIDSYTGTVNVSLKHNQKVVFEAALDADGDGEIDPAVPVGTTYKVEETGVPDYTPTAQITYNGETAKNAINNASTTSGYSLKTVDYDVANVTTTDHTVVGADFNNVAAYTNTYKTVTPTGIVINNLPYILMILVAFGAAFMYLVAKRRKKNQ